MDKKILAYLAGALDADGFFTIKRDTYKMRVVADTRVPVFHERIGFKQTSPAVVDLLHQSFGGSVGIGKPAKNVKHGRPLFTWGVTDRAAAACARALLPFLRVKNSQAALIIALRREKERPRSETRVAVGHRTLGHWTGKPVQVRTMGMSQDAIAIRQHIFEQIKALNDTRSLQPKLG